MSPILTTLPGPFSSFMRPLQEGPNLLLKHSMRCLRITSAPGELNSRVAACSCFYQRFSKDERTLFLRSVN